MSEDIKEDKSPLPGQDPLTGRFQKGHKLAKGNPLGSEAVKLRVWLLKQVKQKDWKAIQTALVDKAKAGDMKAIQIIFSYALGKPLQQVDMNVTSANISPEEAKQRIREFFSI